MADLTVQQAADGAQPFLTLYPNPIPCSRTHVPSEIMEMILCYALAGPLAEDHDDRILSILLVSRLWNQIAQGSREFRSHLPVPRPGANREETETWLERTRPYPIRIWASAYVEGALNLEDDEYAFHPVLGPLEVALREDNLLRVREIHVEGYRDDEDLHLRPLPIAIILDHLANLGQGISLPLEILHIKTNFLQDVRFPDDWPLCPSLRVVDISSGGSLGPDLALFRSPVLTKVLLEGVRDIWYGWRDVQDALEEMSDTVEVLALDLYILPLIDDIGPDGTVPVLPSLRYLRVQDTPEIVAELLRYVCFPPEASLQFSFMMDRAELLSSSPSTLSAALAHCWEAESPFQELIIGSWQEGEISWTARPPPGVAQAGWLRLDMSGGLKGGLLPEHHGFLLNAFTSSKLLLGVRSVAFYTPQLPSRALWQELLVHAPQIEELVIGGKAVMGWIEAMSKPSGIPHVPRLVIAHTTFHGIEPCMHLAQYLRRGTSYGCQRVRFHQCTFEGMTDEAWVNFLNIIGCEVSRAGSQ
ncbi:hypothetical protein FA95DRAFT_924761 [Auriscalpium vulgare]|uniref:Uncharacterized protein n=1 Tax=Auriscalpium vulgare TaxID=40419 RepID=A0ACB8RZF3_9AGAM|nr:hypothetical protein FA95DRAFT_924761 [Auriscalpium vulgare]